MGSFFRLADGAAAGLHGVYPRPRKTVVSKLALAATIEGRAPNRAELANLWPLSTERQDRREQWLRPVLKNALACAAQGLEPLARAELVKVASHGQTVLSRLDQADSGDPLALLLVAQRVVDRR